ncbi:MAG: MFS transporter [Acidimicrobiales bacterium]
MWPAAAGILVVGAGAGWGLIADAATFAVSAAVLSRLRLDHAPPTRTAGVLADLREGWGDFWSRPWFRDVVLGASLYMFLVAMVMVLGPVASERDYHGAVAWAVVATATGVGSLVAAPVVVRIRPRRPLVVALAVGSLEALVPLGFAARLALPYLAVAGALQGVAFLAFESLWQTTVQRLVPQDILSRASSYDYFGSLVAYPVGLAVAGPLAVAVGLDGMLALAGGLMLLQTCVLVSRRSVRRLVVEPASVGSG